MSARWMTLGVWALVAAAAVAWGLRLFVQPQAVPAGTPVVETSPPLQADLTRLLGADPPPPAVVAEAAAPPPDTRFTLLGVVAPRAGSGAREGVALIAVDDRPPRAYRVGARVDGETVLQRVSARGAELGPRGGPARVALQLTPPEPAATGTLPPAAGAAPPPRAGVPAPSFVRPGMPRAPAQGVPQQPYQPQPYPSQPQPVERDESNEQPQRGNAPTLM